MTILPGIDVERDSPVSGRFRLPLDISDRLETPLLVEINGVVGYWLSPWLFDIYAKIGIEYEYLLKMKALSDELPHDIEVLVESKDKIIESQSKQIDLLNQQMVQQKRINRRTIGMVLGFTIGGIFVIDLAILLPIVIYYTQR